MGGSTRINAAADYDFGDKGVAASTNWPPGMSAFDSLASMPTTNVTYNLISMNMYCSRVAARDGHGMTIDAARATIWLMGNHPLLTIIDCDCIDIHTCIGGIGVIDGSTNVYLSDVWKYTIATGLWSFISLSFLLLFCVGCPNHCLAHICFSLYGMGG
jgi:hypothetical protein